MAILLKRHELVLQVGETWVQMGKEEQQRFIKHMQVNCAGTTTRSLHLKIIHKSIIDLPDWVESEEFGLASVNCKATVWSSF